MAFQSIWYFTDLPAKIVDTIEDDLKVKFDPHLELSKVGGGGGGVVDTGIRNARNTWVPTDHWLGGYVWHYVQRANRENFLYDLQNIDSESMQYTVYGKGEYYGWHTDSDLASHYKPMSSGNRGTGEQIASDFINTSCEKVRKLSFSLLLSDPEEYRGGNLELIDETGKYYVAPRQRGTIILFDSRTKHRVSKVSKGIRKSIVGWTVGPRWK